MNFLDISKVKYRLVGLAPDGTRLHLDDLTRDLTWEEQPNELAMRLHAEIQNVKYNGRWLHKLLPLNAKVVLYADWGEGMQEIMRGFITAIDYQTDPLGHFTITAYDNLYPLSLSKDERFYPAGTSAVTIIRDIAKYWQLPLGVVEGPNISLSKQVFRGDRVSDMILKVLDDARKRGAGKFIIRSRQGLIDIVRPGNNAPVFRFDGPAVSSVQDRQDIESLVTRAKLIGSSRSDRRPVVAQLDGRTEFGIFQEVIYQDSYDTPAAAKEAAQQILKESGKPKKYRKIVAPDIPFMRRGDKVYISAGTIIGYFIVSGIDHDATKRTMTMEVEDIE